MTELALIGTGNWGKNLLRNYAMLPSANLRYVCDVDEKRLATYQAQYPDVTFTSDVQRVLDDPAVEAISIAAPAPAHYGLGMQSLQAGKHTYIEKPLALSTEEAKALVEEAERRDLRLMVGHLLLYHPAVAKLKEVVDSGELGDILYIYCQRLNLGVIRRDENALWSLAPHDVSVALYLLGEEQALDVSARGSCYLQPQRGVEDVVFATVNFPGGRMLHLHVSWLDPHKIRRITVVGSKKMAVFDDGASTEKLCIYDKGVETVDYESYGDLLTLRYGDIHIPHVPMSEPLRIECEHFTECVAQGKQPLTDGRSGMAVVQVLEAAQRSLERGGAPVPVERA